MSGSMPALPESFFAHSVIFFVSEVICLSPFCSVAFSVVLEMAFCNLVRALWSDWPCRLCIVEATLAHSQSARHRHPCHLGTADSGRPPPHFHFHSACPALPTISLVRRQAVPAANGAPGWPGEANERREVFHFDLTSYPFEWSLDRWG